MNQDGTPTDSKLVPDPPTHVSLQKKNLINNNKCVGIQSSRGDTRNEMTKAIDSLNRFLMPSLGNRDGGRILLLWPATWLAHLLSESYLRAIYCTNWFNVCMIFPPPIFSALGPIMAAMELCCQLRSTWNGETGRFLLSLFVLIELYFHLISSPPFWLDYFNRLILVKRLPGDAVSFFLNHFKW